MPWCLQLNLLYHIMLLIWCTQATSSLFLKQILVYIQFQHRYNHIPHFSGPLQQHWHIWICCWYCIIVGLTLASIFILVSNRSIDHSGRISSDSAMPSRFMNDKYKYSHCHCGIPGHERLHQISTFLLATPDSCIKTDKAARALQEIKHEAAGRVLYLARDHTLVLYFL